MMNQSSITFLGFWFFFFSFFPVLAQFERFNYREWSSWLQDSCAWCEHSRDNPCVWLPCWTGQATSHSAKCAIYVLECCRRWNYHVRLQPTLYTPTHSFNFYIYWYTITAKKNICNLRIDCWWVHFLWFISLI